MEPTIIGNMIAWVALVIAFVALYRQGKDTQRQLGSTREQLDLTRDQLDVTRIQVLNTITPVVSVRMSGTIGNQDCSLTVSNIGAVDIAELQLTAKVSAVYEMGRGLGDNWCERVDLPIAARVRPGDVVALKLIHIDGVGANLGLVSHVRDVRAIPHKPNYLYGYAYVVGFRRASDMKPFSKVSAFLAIRKSDASERFRLDSFMPMITPPGTGSFRKGSRDWLQAFREDITNLCEKQYDLQNTDLYQ